MRFLEILKHKLMPQNPYPLGATVDGALIVHSECGGYHGPSGRVYYWCKTKTWDPIKGLRYFYRDTSIDDVPISEQNIVTS